MKALYTGPPAWALLWGLLSPAAASPATALDPKATVLQQGAGGYDGCATKTFWGPKAPKPKELPADTSLYLRGTSNRVLLRFQLSAGMQDKGQRLARARLEVFIPKAEKLRMICEILCREVASDWSTGATTDTTTDYHVGRPAGAVDSYSLWEFDGQYFPHKYRFLGVPEGGKWIDFNITPLVRKWLTDPTANHGVALEPIDQADKRFPNQVVIDIPSATSADAAHRPRLVLEFGPGVKPYLVGMTHTLEKYCDRDTRYRFFGPFDESYEMAMAANEFEGFQVLVYPMIEPLKGVSFEWTDLLDKDTGAKIPKEDIECRLPEVVKLHENMKIKDWYFHGKNFEAPDPLTTARPADLPVHMSTPFWFTVHTRPATKAGTYRGRITVKPTNAPPRELELTVKVWNYKVPEKWNFQTMGQTCWEYVWKVYGKLTPEKKPAMKRRYIDFLLDHRFTPTEQYADKLSPDLEDIPYCVQRGANTIYLSGNYRGNTDSLKQRYDEVRKLGLIDMALVYIGDETSKWDLMRQRSDQIRLACPELMIMIGGSFPRKELDGIIDIYDPQIGGESKTYSLTEEMTSLIAQSQAKGEKFFWYDAAGPMLPYPNVQCEDPLIAARAVFWMTWKYGVSGFEYDCYNIWSHNLPDKSASGETPRAEDGKVWPQKSFSTHGWGDTNGDGMLFYPGPEGPFSSVRFENIRDGIEDWESHYVLRDHLDACRAKVKSDPSLAGRAQPLIARAEAILKVPDEVCKDLKTWTWEPQVLLKARSDLGDAIEAMSKLVGEEEMLSARKARQQADLERQRAMLRTRTDAARRAAGSRPSASPFGN
jgi:hypothetical protein